MLLALLPIVCHLPAAKIAMGAVCCMNHGGIFRPPPPPGPPIPVYELPPPQTGSGNRDCPTGTSGGRAPATPGQPATPGIQRQGKTPRKNQGGITIGVDGASWTYWWAYNQSALLLPRLLRASQDRQVISPESLLGRGARREQRLSPAPTAADAKRIATALRARLQSQDGGYLMRASCLFSLAKTGLATLHDLAPHLSSTNTVVRESTILAMGNAGKGLEELRAVYLGDAEAQRLMGGHQPGFRERSFAGYALGLIASRTEDLDTKVMILDLMIEAARNKRERIDVRVAALHALRILDLPISAAEERQRQRSTLATLALDPKASKHDVVRVHAMTALRGALSDQGLARERMERSMVTILTKHQDSASVRQSLVQNLGFLSDDEDDDVVTALIQTAARDKDALSRRFAIMALGRIGGDKARAFLLAGVRAERPRKGEYAWLALALALSCQEKRADGTLAPAGSPPEIGDALLGRFRSLNNRMPAAGVAIALGLIRHKEAAEDIQKRLERWQKHDEPAAYLALSLGLLGHEDSTERLRALMDHAKHREVLVIQTALALSLLDDKHAEFQLSALLQKRQSTAVLSALAMGIGRLGTRSSVDLLIRRLESKESTSRARAFMAVALGELLIQRRLRWNAALSWGIHYRYSPASLTGSAGVLDLL